MHWCAPYSVGRRSALENVQEEHVGTAALAAGLDGPRRRWGGADHAVVVGSRTQEGIAAGRLGCGGGAR